MSGFLNLARKAGVNLVQLDPRFKSPDLLKEIHSELDKTHKEDHKEKIAVFLVCVSSYLPDPSDHCSAALKGDSSAGKDNLIHTCLKHIPKDDSFFLTRATTAALEEEAAKSRIIAFSEINAHREKGANADLTETFKQFAEGGVTVIKKDPSTGFRTTLTIKTEQKSLLYGTTETASDDELETRYVIIPVRSDKEKNMIVVHNVLDEASTYKSFERKRKKSWIADSISLLDPSLHVVIPFAEVLKKPLEYPDGTKKPFFDFTKERIKRDAKRLLSLTRAITWLHQKQRVIIDEDDDKRYLLAEPSDFLAAVSIFMDFFDLTYSGLDFRIQRTLDKLRDLQGKHDADIMKLGFDISKYSGFVLRHKLAEEVGIGSTHTIKAHISTLKDRGFILENVYDPTIPRAYLVKPTPKSRVAIGYKQGGRGWQLPPLATLLTPYLTPSKIKEIYQKSILIPINMDFIGRIAVSRNQIDTLKLTPSISSPDIHSFPLEMEVMFLPCSMCGFDPSKSEGGQCYNVKNKPVCDMCLEAQEDKENGKKE